MRMIHHWRGGPLHGPVTNVQLLPNDAGLDHMGTRHESDAHYAQNVALTAGGKPSMHSLILASKAKRNVQLYNGELASIVEPTW